MKVGGLTLLGHAIFAQNSMMSKMNTEIRSPIYGYGGEFWNAKFRMLVEMWLIGLMDLRDICKGLLKAKNNANIILKE